MAIRSSRIGIDAFICTRLASQCSRPLTPPFWGRFSVRDCFSMGASPLVIARGETPKQSDAVVASPMGAKQPRLPRLRLAMTLYARLLRCARNDTTKNLPPLCAHAPLPEGEGVEGPMASKSLRLCGGTSKHSYDRIHGGSTETRRSAASSSATGSPSDSARRACLQAGSKFWSW
jgi:hypothetical protein